MLTYQLKKRPGVPLYEDLYHCIREDILSGKLPAGTKIPSKRTLCANLEVSKITVEGAYNQLLEEGYIRSVEKVGYFVEAVEGNRILPKISHIPPNQEPAPPVDLSSNTLARFPFSVWSRLQREVIQTQGERLLLPVANQGLWELRTAISNHLAQFRGMIVSPENIVVGAGTDFLYNLLIQLLGQDKCYAVEDPGYDKIRKVYTAAGVRCVSAPMDKKGVLPEKLGNTQVLHISPSHHFPTGIITPLDRRQQLLDWANEEDRYIIEDDYDSEFRFHAHPMATMQSLDKGGRVIYMNTFSKTLAPSVRIGYLVLPDGLLSRYKERLGFYSCTVSSFEQHTLTKFLVEGHFEKHINRMRKFYKARRNRLLSAIEHSPLAPHITILEEYAGLHFLVKVKTALSDKELVDRCRRAGIAISALSEYYHTPLPEQTHCLVVNYSGLSDQQLLTLEELLTKGF